MVIKLEKGNLDQNNNFVPSGEFFIFSGVNNLSDRHSASNIKINAPGKGSSESVALNLSGLQRFVSFDFKLIDDGTDKSNGLNKITIDDQYDYLKNSFFSGNTDSQYRLSVGTLIVIKCLIDDLTINPTFENPNYYKGSIQVVEANNPFSVQ